MTEFEDLPDLPWQAVTREAAASCGVLSEFEIAAEFDRCHAITGHGPAVPNRIAELERQVTEQGAVILDLRVQMADLLGGNRELTGMIDRVDQELADMTAERDHALLRMEVAIATSNGLIDAEVQRQTAKAAALGLTGTVAAITADTLRQQRQTIGLLCTADAGRVRLGGYAPTLPPR